MIDPATVERIKSTADIVDVVGDYVHLIRRGANFMGLCPFHNERTPSFSVNRQRNFCYCFSCKKGGSPVNFIMEKEGLSYHEALLHLARKYGIEVVERELTDEERERQSEREAMFVANEWAMKQMEADLLDTDEGRDVGLQYFTHRGVTDAALKAFHLGYALDNGRHLTEAARKAGFDIGVLKKLGLVGESRQGTEYDRFRGRVIFPILNTAGKVIAFGGRDLKGGLAKYINSPESELYKKSNELYGIYQAKSAIVSEGKCFLVEGYMDVIGMWQSGMKNVVASSGTALTDGQIAMIHRFTDNITLIYDGDAAGIKASLRGIDMLLSHKLNVKVLLLPDGDDPDSFARKHTPEEFKTYVAGHETDIIRYKAQVMLDTIKNDPQKRIAAINSVISSIAHIPDGVSRDVYIQECSELLNVPESTIAKSVAKARNEIVEAIKKERFRKSLSPGSNSDAPQNSDTNLPEQQNPGTDYSGQAKPLSENLTAKQKGTARLSQIPTSPYFKLEEGVIRYCVRYAFLQFCEYEEEDSEGGKIVLDVLQFTDEELRDSQMEFSEPVFVKIFGKLKDMRGKFEQMMASKRDEIETRIANLREERTNELREKDLSLIEIKRAEEQLESELAGIRESFLRDVTKDYPGRILASDEDKDVRDTCFNLIYDKHHLSNIYLKDGVAETEEDRLNVLLIRAIDEWKNEILNQRIKSLMQQLTESAAKGDFDSQQRLQAELANLMTIRTQMAKCIGERIIFTGKVGNK